MRSWILSVSLNSLKPETLVLKNVNYLDLNLLWTRGSQELSVEWEEEDTHCECRHTDTSWEPYVLVTVIDISHPKTISFWGQRYRAEVLSQRHDKLYLCTEERTIIFQSIRKNLIENSYICWYFWIRLADDCPVWKWDKNSVSSSYSWFPVSVEQGLYSDVLFRLYFKIATMIWNIYVLPHFSSDEFKAQRGWN